MDVSGRRGFTLIEVVLVMAIIAISVGMAGPRIGAGFGRLDLNRARSGVQALIKRARLEAGRSDREHYVVLNRQAQSVALIGPDLRILREESLPGSVSFVLDPAVQTATLYVAPSGLVRGNPVRLRGRVGETEVPLR